MSISQASCLLANSGGLISTQGGLSLSHTDFVNGSSMFAMSRTLTLRGRQAAGSRSSHRYRAVGASKFDQATGSGAEGGSGSGHRFPSPSRDKSSLTERINLGGPSSSTDVSTSAALHSEAPVSSNGVARKTKSKSSAAEDETRGTKDGNNEAGSLGEENSQRIERAELVIEEHRREMLNLIEQLEAIRMHALDLEHRNSHQFKQADSRFRESARNLLHYMALRNIDIRKLQQALGDLGLSSLGRTEAHTLASIQAVTGVLRSMLRELPSPKQAVQMNAAREITGMRPFMPDTSSLLAKTGFVSPVMNFSEGDQLLIRNTEDLLGHAPRGRKTHIMVTLPTEAADDKTLVMKLMEAGMDVARVNCAHDDPAVWSRIISHVRRCSVQLGKPCRILMDLAGPKLRTGTLESGVRIAKIKPPKDVLGRQLSPALVWLAPPGVSAPPTSTKAHTSIPLDAPQGWAEALKDGDSVYFTDARGKPRKWKIVGREESIGGWGLWAECGKSAVVQTGTELHLSSAEGGMKKKKEGEKKEGEKKEGEKKEGMGGQVALVGKLPALENPIHLTKGDTLLLVKGEEPGAPAEVNDKGKVVRPARVSCALSQVFENVKVGEPIKLDDGKIEGVIKSVKPEEISVKITRAAIKGTKLKGEKAINLPDSDLKLHGLTAKDLVDLDFIAANADMVAFSFVNDADDVAMLQEELAKRNDSDLGVVLKIETKKAFERLPWMLLQGMKSGNPLGVMIARGDMAVECGWERLAEVQEEILWLCEAAHVPAIWATQVLEGLAKAGLPSRAEITDAAMGERAECVMLNKGPHIVLAVETLNDILSRMRSHQMKKQSMLRPLQVSNPFVRVVSSTSP